MSEEDRKGKFDDWWTGDREATHPFEGYNVPVDLIIKTGAGPTVFDQIAAGHRAALQKWIGVEPQLNFLEVGCGIGRDAMWLSKVLTTGTYTGIDIIKESIDWCQQNIAASHPNFTFHHFDVADELHNPGGASSVQAFRFPCEENAIDRIFGFSVFTHMYADQIAHYLRECARVLKPGGRTYLTIFLYDDAVLASARAKSQTPFDLTFNYEIEPGCRITDPDHPLGAIAFKWERIEGLIREAGLDLAREPLKGSWSGHHQNPDDGQDVLLLTKR